METIKTTKHNGKKYAVTSMQRKAFKRAKTIKTIKRIKEFILEFILLSITLFACFIFIETTAEMLASWNFPQKYLIPNIVSFIWLGIIGICLCQSNK